MKKLKLTKVMASTLAVASVFALNPIGANAEWKQDQKGWWYAEDNSWATGWKQIDGKWYYFYSDGYMAKNKLEDGWYLNDSGAGIECVKIDEFYIVKSTGMIARFGKRGSSGPGVAGIPLVIPKEIGGTEIKSIGYEAFSDCQDLTSITIPDSVTSIGDSAFSGCNSMTSITIPDSVTSIGNDAFGSCNDLSSITIPNSVKSIGQGAFDRCYHLTSVTIPDGVTSIKDYTFTECIRLTNVKIPNSVTSIEGNAFYNCSNLTSVTIPDSVQSIGDEAFYGCNNAMFYVKNEKVKQLLIYSGVSPSKITVSA